MTLKDESNIQFPFADIQRMVSESVGMGILPDARLDAATDKWTRETCFYEAKKYKSRGEFQKGARGAYNAARKNGWIGDYTWFAEKKKPNGYWTKETCYEEASKYHSSKEFQKASGSAYAISVRNGWISDYTWFVSPIKPKGYWNRETCYEEAKKYKSRAEFNRECSTGYGVARTKGWLDDYIWFKERIVSERKIYIVYCYRDEETNSIYVGLTNNLKRRHNQHCNGFLKRGELKYDIVYRFFHSIGKEPPEPIIVEKNLYADEAQIYEELYVEQFKKAGYNVLNLAKTGSLGGYGKWDKKTCYKEAKKYKSKLDFRNNSSGAYQAARKNGWLDEYTWLDKVFGKWTREACYEEAKLYKSRTAFQNGSKGAYLKAFRSGWLDNYTWLTRPEVHNKIWDRETCYEEAKNYSSRNEFRRGNGSAYGVALKNGWLNEYTWFEQKRRRWDRESCYNAAKRYKSRGEFSDNCGSAYDAARENGWLDDYTWFSQSKTAVKWTREVCMVEANKYTTKNAFKKHSESAYNAACRQGWLDEYTWLSRSKKPDGYWTQARCYDEAKKYRSRSEFSANSSKAYNVSLKNGWLDSYSWFEQKHKHWDRASCYEAAKKFKTIGDFARHHGAAYLLSRKNGWMDDYIWFRKPTNLKEEK